MSRARAVVKGRSRRKRGAEGEGGITCRVAGQTLDERIETAVASVAAIRQLRANQLHRHPEHVLRAYRAYRGEAQRPVPPLLLKLLDRAIDEILASGLRKPSRRNAVRDAEIIRTVETLVQTTSQSRMQVMHRVGAQHGLTLGAMKQIFRRAGAVDPDRSELASRHARRGRH